MSEKITVKEAAEIMGVNPQFLRMGLQHEKFPFGAAVRGKGRWSYYINRKRFETYLKAEDMLTFKEVLDEEVYEVQSGNSQQ